MKRFVLTGILYLFVFPIMIYAQEGAVSKSEWLSQIAEQEQKISAFIATQLKNNYANESLRKEFLAGERHEEVTESEWLRMADDYLKAHYRKEYFKQHPETVALFSPFRVKPEEAVPREKPAGSGAINMLCNYGDFETATSNNLASRGYNGYAGPTFYYYTGGLCNFVPPVSVSHLYNNVGFGNPNHFMVTNNIPDPNVPAINQTNNGSKHAVRINGYQNCDLFGINMLQKAFTAAATGKGRINFSYALVIQAPHSGTEASGNAFFVARLVDNSGNEVGSRICVSSGSAGSNFNTTQIPDCKRTPNWKVTTLWRDWDCNFIEFDAEAGKTYTLEIFVAACRWNVHYAYAYVDDICADIDCCPNLPPAPSNLKCVPGPDVSHLSWDPVPGALSYKVSITTNDPACCDMSNFGLAKVLMTNTPNVSVPRSFAPCFSWKVQAVMSEECSTDFSDPLCSCTPRPPGPVGLDCVPGANGSNLSWTPVPGAVSYKVSLTTNDPFCCPESNFGLAKLFTTNTASISIPQTEAACFSWRVRAVFADGMESELSDRNCSCTPPPPPPTGLGCTPGTDASDLYWNPVPGAVSYKISMTTNDPACCPNSGFGLAKQMTSTSPNVTVPRSFAECFSWRVRAVMPDGTETALSNPLCSCTPPPREGKPANTNWDAKMSVSAVPNPASKYINFTVSNRDKEQTPEQLSLSLYDINGKEVVRKEMDAQDQLRLDIHAFANGVYTYEIRSSQQTLFKDKVIIEK